MSLIIDHQGLIDQIALGLSLSKSDTASMVSCTLFGLFSARLAEFINRLITECKGKATLIEKKLSNHFLISCTRKIGAKYEHRNHKVCLVNELFGLILICLCLPSNCLLINECFFRIHLNDLFLHLICNRQRSIPMLLRLGQDGNLYQGPTGTTLLLEVPNSGLEAILNHFQ